MERTLAAAYDAVGWEPPTPPSFEACGGGQGPACCKFLIAGPDGMECARYTELHPMLAERAMGSAFIPTKPDCQAQRGRSRMPS